MQEDVLTIHIVGRNVSVKARELGKLIRAFSVNRKKINKLHVETSSPINYIEKQNIPRITQRKNC